MAISVFVLWVTCWALAQLFPIMNDRLGAAGSFWIFGVLPGRVSLYTGVPSRNARQITGAD